MQIFEELTFREEICKLPNCAQFWALATTHGVAPLPVQDLLAGSCSPIYVVGVACFRIKNLRGRCGRGLKYDRCRQPSATFFRLAIVVSTTLTTQQFRKYRVDQICNSADETLSQDNWDQSEGQLHLDTSQSTLVIRPQSAATNAGHKAPLAPKQGLGGALANARGQHSSPISGTYALRTPRGKITSIACESCRKRKSKVRGHSIAACR